MKYKLPKVLVLDYEKWRCGGFWGQKDSSLGKGETRLLNYHGYMCCLGQFSEQCGIACDLLLYKETPIELKDITVPVLQSKSFVSNALAINDGDLPILIKLKRLRNLCHRRGRKLHIKNLPFEYRTYFCGYDVFDNGVNDSASASVGKYSGESLEEFHKRINND